MMHVTIKETFIKMLFSCVSVSLPNISIIKRSAEHAIEPLLTHHTQESIQELMCHFSGSVRNGKACMSIYKLLAY